MPATGQPLLDQLVSAIEQMQSQIEALQGQVATLTIQQRLGGTPIDEQASASDELVRWVAWLIKRYGLDETIPGCWAEHAPIHEELSALRSAHAGAYDAIEGRANDLLQWHEALQRCLSRVRDWDKAKCRARGHTA